VFLVKKLASSLESGASRPTLRERPAKDVAPTFRYGKKEQNLGEGSAARPLIPSTRTELVNSAVTGAGERIVLVGFESSPPLWHSQNNHCPGKENPTVAWRF
jgi:hypothetical protein